MQKTQCQVPASFRPSQFSTALEPLLFAGIEKQKIGRRWIVRPSPTL